MRALRSGREHGRGRGTQRVPSSGRVVLRSGRERERGRGTQRVPSGRVCAWCRRAGRNAGECTWKVDGHQDKFTCAADVRRACAGHMIASVWDGTRVRWQNKDRLRRYRSASIAGCSSHVPQHDWAEHVLDACKYEELLAAASAGSSDSGSSSDHWSDSDSSSEEQATSVDAAATHRDWGTKYAGVDTLLRRAVVSPGELRGQGLQCRWCSHVPVQGESCYATSGSGQVRGVVARLGCASARLLNRNFVSNLPMVADRRRSATIGKLDTIFRFRRESASHRAVPAVFMFSRACAGMWRCRGAAGRGRWCCARAAP